MHQDSPIRRLVVAAFVFTLGFAVLTGTAHAQEAPEDCSVVIGDYEGSAVITVDPVNVTPGGSVTLTGSGFPPGVAVPLFFNDAAIGSPVTDETGSFTFVYTIPADTPAGVFEFSAACGTFILTSNITITPIPGATTVPPTTQPLPVTGSDSLPMAQAGVALVVIGGVIVLVSKRKNDRTAVHSASS